MHSTEITDFLWRRHEAAECAGITATGAWKRRLMEFGGAAFARIGWGWKLMLLLLLLLLVGNTVGLLKLLELVIVRLYLLLGQVLSVLRLLWIGEGRRRVMTVVEGLLKGILAQKLRSDLLFG